MVNSSRHLVDIGGRTIRLLLAITVIIIITLGGIFAYALYRQESLARAESFLATAELANDALIDELNNYNDLLYTGRGFLQNNPQLTPAQWDNHFREQDTFTRYPGVSSISYISLVDRAEVEGFIATLREQTGDTSLSSDELVESDEHALVTMVSSDNDLAPFSIIDMYQLPGREAVYTRALDTQLPTASPVLTLGSNKVGFFTVLPSYSQGEPAGLVVAAFRVEQLVQQLIPSDNTSDIMFTIQDVSDDQVTTIYEDPRWHTDGKSVATFHSTVGSRTWKVTATHVHRYSFMETYGMAIAIGCGSLLLAALLIVSTRLVEHLRTRHRS